MFIHTQLTPNPQTQKFIPGVAVLESGTMSFFKDKDYSISPLAKVIFEVEGVTSLFFTTDFITVTKAADQDWEYLKPIILAAIVDHYVAGLPVIEKQSEKPEASEVGQFADEIITQIIELIETRVRPAVAEDGGDIIFKDFKDGTVYLELQGSCSGCPSSTITLKNGIENMLKHYIPEVERVESI
jgi:NFU1 iron-sulfur cluster scaffold homolog, mitochondrial